MSFAAVVSWPIGLAACLLLLGAIALWIRSAADLLWMLVLRPGLVGFVTLVVAIVIGTAAILAKGADVSRFPALSIAAALISGPPIASFMANLIAWRRAHQWMRRSSAIPDEAPPEPARSGLNWFSWQMARRRWRKLKRAVEQKPFAPRVVLVYPERSQLPLQSGMRWLPPMWRSAVGRAAWAATGFIFAQRKGELYLDYERPPVGENEISGGVS
jgi:hypothetical protein